jgi:phage terminase large subunit-like protein
VSLDTFALSPAFASLAGSVPRRAIIRGGHRVGLTRQTAACLARVMRDNPGRRYRIVTVDPPHVRMLVEHMRGFLPDARLVDGALVCDNGAVCEFGTLGQHRDRHAGSDLDGIWCDNLPTWAILAESLRRVMSRSGFLWVSLTPTRAPDSSWLRNIAEQGPWVEYAIPLNVTNCPWYTPEQLTAWLAEVRAVMPDEYAQVVDGEWPVP